MEGLLKTHQPQVIVQFGFDVNFKTNGPFDRDWIYGHWLDGDSIIRMVGYREGGKWQSLPFSASQNSVLADIAQYGDTMYMGGYFRDVVLDATNDFIPHAGILKYYNDSLWASPKNFHQVRGFAVSGDSLLIEATAYFGENDTIASYILCTNGGATLTFPYSVVHPTLAYPDFGLEGHLGIRDSDIYTLNDGSSGHYKGVVRWDGHQWHGYGGGIYGTWAKAYDYEFFQGDLYMAGSFSKSQDPRNPGERVVRWNGSDWESLGGGTDYYSMDLFVHDSLLYCHSEGDIFGDAQIPYLAAWDGQQWRGTPVTFSGATPHRFGIIDDTLYAVWRSFPATADGQPLSYINYFDGDYVNGVGAIGSTQGLGDKEQQEKLGRIDVFPNPATDEVRISVGRTSEAEAMPLTVQIFDVKGFLVNSTNLESSSSSAVISTDSWEAGVYIIEVSANGNAAEYGRLVVKP